MLVAANAQSESILRLIMSSQHLGDWLRNKRKSAGLTQQELSDISKERGEHVGQSYIAKIENGTAKNVTPKIIRALGMALNLLPAEVEVGLSLSLGTDPAFIRPSGTRLPAKVEVLVRDLMETLGGSEIVRIPVIGKVTAGKPLLLAENIEDYVYVSRDMVRDEEKHSCYAVRVNGRSMEGALIGDGDLLIVKFQEDAEDGQIVVALTSDDEVTVKRLRKRRNIVSLESDYMDGRRDEIVLNGGRIIGLVIGQRRDYRHHRIDQDHR